MNLSIIIAVLIVVLVVASSYGLYPRDKFYYNYETRNQSKKQDSTRYYAYRDVISQFEMENENLKRENKRLMRENARLQQQLRSIPQ